MIYVELLDVLNTFNGPILPNTEDGETQGSIILQWRHWQHMHEILPLPGGEVTLQLSMSFDSAKRYRLSYRQLQNNSAIVFQQNVQVILEHYEVAKESFVFPPAH